MQQWKQQQSEAELAVIQHETFNAQAQLELTQAQQQVANEQVLVDIAKELALAKLCAENPAYAALQIAIANAAAMKVTDKLIITPDDVFPNLIFTDAGVLPTVNVP